MDGTITDDGRPLFLTEADLDKVREFADEADPTTQADRALMAKWRDQRIRSARDHWRSWFTKIRQAYSYYQGDFYFNQNHLGDLHYTETTPSDDPRVPDNYFAVLINAVVARILADKPMPMALPGAIGDVDDNHTVARLSNHIMRQIERSNRGDVTEQLRVLHAVLGGVGWKRAWYDPTRSGKANVLVTDPETGEEREEIQDAATGEVVYTVHSGLEVLMEPTTEFEHCYWLVHVLPRPLAHVVAEFERGKFVRPTSAQERDLWLGSEEAYKGIPAPKDIGDADPSSLSVEIVYCYERVVDPQTGVQTWHRMTFCEDTLLEPMAPVGSECPLKPFFFNNNLWDCSGTTLAWDLIPLQREINRAMDGQAARLRLHQHPKPLVPENGEFPENFFDNTPDPVECPVDASGKMVKPEWMIPPDIDSQGAEQHIAMLKYEMADLAGIHETSRGICDPGIKSGKHAQIAAQQDNTNLQRPRSNWLAAEESFWTYVLGLVAEHYPDGKVIEISGPHGMRDIEVFRAADFQNPGQVQMKSMSRLPMEPQGKLDFVMNLTSSGFFTLPEPIQTRIFAMLGFEESMEEDLAWRIKAKALVARQMDLLREGQPPFVLEHQDVGLFIDLLTREVNTPQFLDLQPEIQANFAAAINMAMQIQQMRMMQQMGPQAGAMAPAPIGPPPMAAPGAGPPPAGA
ncbi:MAG TPA: hypothetical protein PKM73_14460 [Verrucomicrobiota bacterium]|nr:hypothetical protein [Verrucomicrobiota bacterium]